MATQQKGGVIEFDLGEATGTSDVQSSTEAAGVAAEQASRLWDAPTEGFDTLTTSFFNLLVPQQRDISGQVDAGDVPMLRVVFEELQERVDALERELADLKNQVLEEEVIMIRTISREEAKQEILGLFESGETLFFSDIAKRLRLDLPLVVEICQELLEEGKVGVNDNAI